MPLKVSPSTLENPDVELLPVEELANVDGIDKMVKCHYIGTISSAKEMSSKSDGSDYLKVTVQINRPNGDIVYIDDILTYKKPYVRRLSELTTMLKLDEKAKAGLLEADDFMGHFVIVTISHERFTPTSGPGAGKEQTSNKIAEFVRAATAEEIKAASDLPF